MDTFYVSLNGPIRRGAGPRSLNKGLEFCAGFLLEERLTFDSLVSADQTDTPAKKKKITLTAF